MMTIIGVFGCTSMIIAGFALRDSIASMIPKQYGEIDKYNISISLGEEYSQKEIEKIQNKILENEQITASRKLNKSRLQRTFRMVLDLRRR